MAEEAPVAAAPQATEINQTNNTPEQAPAEAPASQEITAEQVAKFFKTSPEQIADMQKFYGANGGPEKAFEKVKNAVSAKPAEAPAQPQPSPQPQMQQQPTAPKPAGEGMMSPDMFMTQQYFGMLSGDEKYKSIASELRDGTALQEMAKFGIKPVVDGNINDARIRMFLDMYSKTKPALTPTNPDSNTPTVEFYQTPDGKINTEEQARAIYSQPNHPQHKEAVEFFRNKFRSAVDKKPEQK